VVRRIALVGAGYISRVHAAALQSIAGVRVTAIVDPARSAAESLACSCDGASVFASVDEALSAAAFDCAHLLVPPPLHRDIALQLLAAGKPLFVEKPFAASGEACAELLRSAGQNAVPLGVNQNFVHHPAFVRLQRLVTMRTLGRPNFVGCIYNVPLRQMAARQFGHWMFAAPLNILLEQAVHPLSQIATLAGSIGRVAALAGPAMPIAPGVAFHPSLDVSLACADLPAHLRFAVGQNFPFWQVTAVCDDGVVVADILANRVFTYRRTRWLESVDGLASGARTAAATFAESCRNMAEYAGATLHLTGRNDPFFQSMRASIAAFHAALDAGRPPALDGRFGAMLVEACERIGSCTFQPASLAAPVVRTTPPAGACDIAILGGTGFIGTHVVGRFVAQGSRVSVMARSIRNLPAIFQDDAVALHAGDTRNADDVAAAIGNAPIVINLAHGGGGGSWQEVRDAMVGSAETVAKVCLARKVRRLIHIGSIASLYLGPQSVPVTGTTPPDPQAEERADYARAKAMTDQLLLALHASDGLPVCILRPGVVVGEGGLPFHSGLGFFNNEQHCIGWNTGRNPLPFVLVEDVADAIVLASRAEGIDGRCYNLIGDVRLSARDYILALGRAMQRPLRFHPQSPDMLWLREYGKFLVKRVTGRPGPPPSRRDLLSRGMTATFDCDDAKRDLGWHPNADVTRFGERAIQVFAA
jgi:nucleoside-diphosphate-sugar epimerase/predicted dehydrogenase